MERQHRNGKGLRGRRMTGRVEGLEERRLLAVVPTPVSTYEFGHYSHELNDRPLAAAADSFGNAYFGGYVTRYASSEVDSGLGNKSRIGYIQKQGGQPLARQIEQRGHSEIRGLAADQAGNVYMVGYTVSASWYKGNPNDGYHGGGDAFVAELSASGLYQWVRYLGGSDTDTANAVTVSAAGEVYVVGTTSSTDWDGDVIGSGYGGGGDAFVAKLGPDGSVAWSRCLGGTASDMAAGVAVDAAGSVYVAGTTSSAGWVGGGVDTTLGGGSDGFVAQLSSDGTLVWSSYLGGAFDDGVNALAVSRVGAVFVAGSSSSPDWLGQGRFVAGIGEGGAVAWVRHLDARGLAVDEAGDVYVTGVAGWPNWMGGGSQTYTRPNGDGGAYAAKLHASGEIVWAIHVSLSKYLIADAIAVGPTGDVWVAGHWWGQDLASHGLVVRVVQREPIVVQGTGGDDTITVGSSGADYTVTVNGSTSVYRRDEGAWLEIHGLGGNDIIDPDGIYSPIAIYGGEGNDTITGSWNNSSLYGGAGDDLITGRLGDDLIEGGEGNDTLRGTWGRDSIYGHDGADWMEGGAGDDELYGNPGNDTLYGGEGNDVVFGQGNDDVLYGNGGNDLLNGGDGVDELRAGLGDDRLLGGIGNDSLYGGDGSDMLSGDDGADYIEGRGKADTIYGGVGNDTIYGGAGADWIAGEDGDDWVDVGVSAVWRDSVEGGAGRDTVRADGDDVLGGVEVVVLG